MILVKMREMMQRRGIKTQKKLSKLTGISENSLSKISTGQGFRHDSIEKLCASLDCQPGDLLEYVPDDPSA